MSAEKPTIEEYLATRRRVWGPHGWLSWVAALFGIRRLAYPARMQDQLDSGLIPVKFAECLEFNQKLYPCCRRIENMTARFFKTDPRLPHPDIFVATCSCGRNHIRIRHDPVRHDINETEADRIANATSILDQPLESGVKYDA